MNAGRRSSRSGVTLMEMLVVVAIIGVLVGISFPSISAGIETLRLRQASDEIVATLNAASNRADRRQVAVEVVIDPAARRIAAISAEPGFRREVLLPEGVTLESVRPSIPGIDPAARRQFLIHPGGAVPRIAVELKNRKNVRRLVSVDPITGVAEVKETP